MKLGRLDTKVVSGRLENEIAVALRMQSVIGPYAVVHPELLSEAVACIHALEQHCGELTRRELRLEQERKKSAMRTLLAMGLVRLSPEELLFTTGLHIAGDAPLTLRQPYSSDELRAIAEYIDDPEGVIGALVAMAKPGAAIRVPEGTMQPDTKNDTGAQPETKTQ